MKTALISSSPGIENDLHSSMDRFEVFNSLCGTRSGWHLHSSMDRFEGGLFLQEATAMSIYIPVWIDLKILKLCVPTLHLQFTFQYG